MQTGLGGEYLGPPRDCISSITHFSTTKTLVEGWLPYGAYTFGNRKISTGLAERVCLSGGSLAMRLVFVFPETQGTA